MSQQSLQGIRSRQSHANLGKDFESTLDRTHRAYALGGHAAIHHLLNAFEWCSEREYLGLGEHHKARLGNGLTIRRILTPCDYIGVARGRAVHFDAKEFSDDKISLKEFKEHQVDHLCAAQRAGAIAGFMIYAKLAQAVFWVDALTARDLTDRARFVRRGKVKGVVKSLSLKWLTENALWVTLLSPGDTLCEWMDVLLEMRK